MNADARARGKPCHKSSTHICLPTLGDGLETYYQHVDEYCNKLRQDLKEAECWEVDPRAAAGLGVEGLPSAPSLGIEENNLHTLRTSWPRWDPMEAPEPAGTKRKFKEFLATHNMVHTYDKEILYNEQAWVWDHPTWFISGVSAKKSKKVLQLSPLSLSLSLVLSLSLSLSLSFFFFLSLSPSLFLLIVFHVWSHLSLRYYII